MRVKARRNCISIEMSRRIFSNPCSAWSRQLSLSAGQLSMSLQVITYLLNSICHTQVCLFILSAQLKALRTVGHKKSRRASLLRSWGNSLRILVREAASTSLKIWTTRKNPPFSSLHSNGHKNHDFGMLARTLKIMHILEIIIKKQT